MKSTITIFDLIKKVELYDELAIDIVQTKLTKVK